MDLIVYNDNAKYAEKLKDKEITVTRATVKLWR